MFFLFQAFTALLLFLAANTSFNAFPRLLAILAQDGYMPRQFAFRGDRLAYSYGIIVLGGVAALLVIGFGAVTHLLIPLYAVGVFIDFTISQTGMIRHWLRERSPGWRRRLVDQRVRGRPDRRRRDRRDRGEVPRPAPGSSSSSSRSSS